MTRYQDRTITGIPRCPCGSSMIWFPTSERTGRKGHWRCYYSEINDGQCRRPVEARLKEIYVDYHPNGLDPNRDYDVDAKETSINERA